MNVIANWQLSLDGVGTAAVYQYEFGYSGGFVVVGLGDGDQFAVCSLGNSEIALAVGMHDDTKNKDYTLYWNSHYPATSGYDANGMMLWYAPSDLEYISDTVGPEQTFKVANLGNGTVSLQATAGAFGGQYLSGELGGAYPNEWGFGSGVVVSSASPTAFQVGGDLLALLQITNSGYRTDLHGRDFGTIDLTGANLRECILDGANLTKIASMKGADFTGAHLRGANLGGLDLSNAATWSHGDFTGSDLRSIAGAPAAQLPGAVLDGADLSGRNLAGANLQGAKLRGTVLTGTNLTGAHLDGADLTGAKLGGTILHGASMLGTHFDKVDLTTAQFDPAPSFTRAVTSRTTFVGATVPFPVLAANCSYLDLSGATLTNLPNTIASLVADHVLLPDGQDFSGLDLTGASFAGARMYEAQLVRTNLHGASLRGALLKGAKLVGANLTLADLDSAYLIAEQTAGGLLELDKTEAAVVSDAYLFNTILDGAHCDGVDFSGSTFVTASSLSSSQSASAVGASMNFAKFDDAQAVLAVFNGAQLSAASFASATLVSASFQDNGSSATQLTPSSDSTHTPASVYKADLRGTNFTGANMDGLDMREASYSTSSGEFEKLYDGFGGTKVPVAFRYAATQLGVTTAATTCPDGHDGPCTLRA
jgi:uncharacterized protein YjbI with pentapeptide repeats